MPQHLRAACFIYIATLITQAILAPLHEDGTWRFETPVRCLSLATIAVLFIRRSQWTWPYMLWIAFFGVLVSALFFPTDEYYGQHTVPAQVLAVVEIGVCVVIAWSIFRHKATKRWFMAAQ